MPNFKFTVEVTKAYDYVIEFVDFSGQHLPEKDTKMTRDTGLYSLRTKRDATAMIADAESNGGQAQLA